MSEEDKIRKKTLLEAARLCEYIADSKTLAGLESCGAQKCSYELKILAEIIK